MGMATERTRAEFRGTARERREREEESFTAEETGESQRQRRILQLGGTLEARRDCSITNIERAEGVRDDVLREREL